MALPGGDTSAIISEFEGVDLGDERLARRLLTIVSRLAAAPAESFPERMRSTAEREALYRFLGNSRVSGDALMAGHVEETRSRIGRCEEVRIVHDTTDFAFEGDRDGLGIIEGEVRGFLGHFALAVGPGEDREPLGVLGLCPFVHQHTAARRGMTNVERILHTRALPRKKKESSRWERLATTTDRLVPDGVRAIHVMDQDADDYTALAELHQAGLRFVVRGSPTRITKQKGLSLEEVLAACPASLFRTVRASRRPRTTKRSRNPAREERDAQLMIRWSPVVLRRPQYAQTECRELALHAVQVTEPHPPAGEQPIDWLLLTSETVDTLESATRVVDHYRARWLIEEYFKALKTGCAFEKRQLTNYAALLRALALFIPMAWQLLALRHVARARPAEPADYLFDGERLRLIGFLLKKHRSDHHLGNKPSLRDAMLAVAALGGHIPNNGEPGWLVLGRGFRKLVEAEDVWRAAQRCDQS